MSFELDSVKAIQAVAEVFRLNPEDAEEWRLDRFGADLSDSIAALAEVVFAPRRDALSAPEELIIDVHGVVDLHSFPLVVCLWEPGAGAFIGSGVEDARELVTDVLAVGPAVILEALESLLEVVANAYDCARSQGGARTRAASVPALVSQATAGVGRVEWRRFSHPRIASTASGRNCRAVLSLSG